MIGLWYIQQSYAVELYHIWKNGTHTLTNLFLLLNIAKIKYCLILNRIWIRQARGIDIKNVEVGVSWIWSPTFSVAVFFFVNAGFSSECLATASGNSEVELKVGRHGFGFSRFTSRPPLTLVVLNFMKVLANALVPHERPFWVTMQGGVCRVCVVKRRRVQRCLWGFATAIDLQTLSFETKIYPFPNMWPACTSDLGLSHTFSLLLFPSWWWWIAVSVGVSFECTWTSIKSIHPLPYPLPQAKSVKAGTLFWSFDQLTNMSECKEDSRVWFTDSNTSSQWNKSMQELGRQLRTNWGSTALRQIGQGSGEVMVIAIETKSWCSLVKTLSHAQCEQGKITWSWSKGRPAATSHESHGTFIFNLYPWGNLSRNAF